MPNFIKQTCDYCRKDFLRLTRHIAAHRIGNCKNTFCSHACKNQSQNIQVTVQCKFCSIQFLKTRSQLIKSPNNFCSRSCAASYNNTHKSYGIRRSKLEIYLESRIREIYPSLLLLCNDKTAIDSELDFYFPDLHLAIELNGIVHYEPIFGDTKLSKIQSNDTKKAYLCNQKHINLAVIDTSSCKYLNHKAKNKFWNLIQMIIKN